MNVHTYPFQAEDHSTLAYSVGKHTIQGAAVTVPTAEETLKLIREEIQQQRRENIL